MQSWKPDVFVLELCLDGLLFGIVVFEPTALAVSVITDDGGGRGSVRKREACHQRRRRKRSRVMT